MTDDQLTASFVGKALTVLPYILDEAIDAMIYDENGNPIDSNANTVLSGSLNMSHALAESVHGLTLNESRMMMLAMRCIDPSLSPYKYARDGYVKVRVTAAEFGELANFKSTDGYTPRAAYAGLKAACKNIHERTAICNDGETQVKKRWVFKAQYHDEEAWAEICFSPDMTQHIFMLGKRFVRYRLGLARGLRSVYSSNLLRLLMTQKDTGFKTITIEDFRRTMEVPEQYRYCDIKRYAIVAPVKDLNDKAEMRIEWKEIKRGRLFHSLQFTFAMLRPEDKGRQAELDL